MKFSQLLLTSLCLTAASQAVYPAPAGIDSSDPDLVVIQSDKSDKGKAVAAIADIPPELKDTPKSSPSNLKADASSDSSMLGGIIDPDLADKAKSEFHAFFLSVSMIIVSEIGDKTFLVAALMAMKHDRLIVFSSAFSALVVMTVLSGVAGHALPALLPQRLTQFLAAILFVVFGINLLREGLAMDKNAGVHEEMAEVEEEIEVGAMNNALNSRENPGPGPSKPMFKEILDNIKNLANHKLLSLLWLLDLTTGLLSWVV
ncbi:unnamed protein product [Ambrosiozyma monospora]|uniref:GDT1 family protein n=1 Tax=Ambrosiozyma monospora TaxID=43982 RepID=A0A9W7DHM1_AMBMO|nr:unnamed protein product [Ambrosiozyma monospora]